MEANQALNELFDRREKAQKEQNENAQKEADKKSAMLRQQIGRKKPQIRFRKGW